MLASGCASRRGIAYAVANQHCPECVEHAAQSPVHIELRSARHYSRDFVDGQLVFETQPKEQPVIGLERCDRRFQGAIELKRPHPFFRSAARSVDELHELGLIGDQVDEAPAHPVAVFATVVFASHSSVLLAVMIEAQSAGYDDKPGRELAAPVGPIAAQTMKVVPTKLLQHERVAIHDIVVIAAEGVSDVQNQLAIGAYECGPRIIARGWLEMTEQVTQLVRDR